MGGCQSNQAQGLVSQSNSTYSFHSCAQPHIVRQKGSTRGCNSNAIIASLRMSSASLRNPDRPGPYPKGPYGQTESGIPLFTKTRPPSTMLNHSNGQLPHFQPSNYSLSTIKSMSESQSKNSLSSTLSAAAKSKDSVDVAENDYLDEQLGAEILSIETEHTAIMFDQPADVLVRKRADAMLIVDEGHHAVTSAVHQQYQTGLTEDSSFIQRTDNSAINTVDDDASDMLSTATATTIRSPTSDDSATMVCAVAKEAVRETKADLNSTFDVPKSPSFSRLASMRDRFRKGGQKLFNSKSVTSDLHVAASSNVTSTATITRMESSSTEQRSVVSSHASPSKKDKKASKIDPGSFRLSTSAGSLVAASSTTSIPRPASGQHSNRFGFGFGGGHRKKTSIVSLNSCTTLTAGSSTLTTTTSSTTVTGQDTSGSGNRSRTVSENLTNGGTGHLPAALEAEQVKVRTKTSRFGIPSPLRYSQRLKSKSFDVGAPVASDSSKSSILAKEVRSSETIASNKSEPITITQKPAKSSLKKTLLSPAAALRQRAASKKAASGDNVKLSASVPTSLRFAPLAQLADMSVGESPAVEFPPEPGKGGLLSPPGPGDAVGNGASSADSQQFFATAIGRIENAMSAVASKEDSMNNNNVGNNKGIGKRSLSTDSPTKCVRPAVSFSPDVVASNAEDARNANNVLSPSEQRSFASKLATSTSYGQARLKSSPRYQHYQKMIYGSGAVASGEATTRCRSFDENENLALESGISPRSSSDPVRITNLIGSKSSSLSSSSTSGTTVAAEKADSTVVVAASKPGPKRFADVRQEFAVEHLVGLLPVIVEASPAKSAATSTSQRSSSEGVMSISSSSKVTSPAESNNSDVDNLDSSITIINRSACMVDRSTAKKGLIDDEIADQPDLLISSTRKLSDENFASRTTPQHQVSLDSPSQFTAAGVANSTPNETFTLVNAGTTTSSRSSGGEDIMNQSYPSGFLDLSSGMTLPSLPGSVSSTTRQAASNRQGKLSEQQALSSGSFKSGGASANFFGSRQSSVNAAVAPQQSFSESYCDSMLSSVSVDDEDLMLDFELGSSYHAGNRTYSINDSTDVADGPVSSHVSGPIRRRESYKRRSGSLRNSLQQQRNSLCSVKDELEDLLTQSLHVVAMVERGIPEDFAAREEGIDMETCPEGLMLDQSSASQSSTSGIPVIAGGHHSHALTSSASSSSNGSVVGVRAAPSATKSDGASSGLIKPSGRSILRPPPSAAVGGTTTADLLSLSMGGGAGMNAHTYTALTQDVTVVKTLLLRLKRVLQDSDTLSPFDSALLAKNGILKCNGDAFAATNGGTGSSVENQTPEDIQAENAELKRQLMILSQALDDRDRTIRILQQQIDLVRRRSASTAASSAAETPVREGRSFSANLDSSSAQTPTTNNCTPPPTVSAASAQLDCSTGGSSIVNCSNSFAYVPLKNQKAPWSNNKPDSAIAVSNRSSTTSATNAMSTVV